MPSIEQLQKALESTEGKTPKEVLDAFLPKDKRINGLPLVDLTFGHSLFLSQVGHPLAEGKLHDWEPHETGLALYAFTRSSKVLKDEVRDGSLEENLYLFMDGIEMGDIMKFTALLMAHYLQSIQTGIEMKDPNPRGPQKKTLSDGFFQALREFVGSITGRLTSLFTNCR